MGEHSTYWNLYFGWGLLVGVLTFTLAAILWILSDLTRIAPRRLGVITGIIAAISGISAYISFRYFYLPPFLSYLAVCVILLTVSVRLLRAPTLSSGGERGKLMPSDSKKASEDVPR